MSDRLLSGSVPPPDSLSLPTPQAERRDSRDYVEALRPTVENFGELMQIKIKVDVSDAIRGLRSGRAALQNLTPAFKQCGEYYLEVVDRRFADERDPDGDAWATPTERHRRRKRRRGEIDKTLQMVGTLRAGINYEASRDELRVGSDRIYAPTHEFGDASRNIPARPFLRPNRADIAEFGEIIADQINRGLQGRRV